MWPGTIAEYGITGDSLTSVTATPGAGRMPNIFTKRRCALPAPSRTTCFWIGTAEAACISSVYGPLQPVASLAELFHQVHPNHQLGLGLANYVQAFVNSFGEILGIDLRPRFDFFQLDLVTEPLPRRL